MKIQCGLTATMEMQPRYFQAKNWLYLQGQGSKICINLDNGELVRGQCHKAPGLNQSQIAKIISDWNNESTSA